MSQISKRPFSASASIKIKRRTTFTDAIGIPLPRYGRVDEAGDELPGDVADIFGGLVGEIDAFDRSEPMAQDNVLFGIKQRPGDGQSMTHAVSRVLRARVMLPNTSLEEIASEFTMQPRTLNRRLQAEGTTFRELINEARFKVARRLLKGKRIPIADIAVALGYANASGFSHAFQRWSGVAPSEWQSHERSSIIRRK